MMTTSTSESGAIYPCETTSSSLTSTTPTVAISPRNSISPSAVASFLVRIPQSLHSRLRSSPPTTPAHSRENSTGSRSSLTGIALNSIKSSLSAYQLLQSSTPQSTPLSSAEISPEHTQYHSRSCSTSYEDDSKFVLATLANEDNNKALLYQPKTPDVPSLFCASPSKSPSSTSLTSSSETLPSSTIQWRYANQGLQLLEASKIEHNLPATQFDSQYERKTFFDGLSYLHKSIPRDMTESELHLLRESLPETAFLLRTKGDSIEKSLSSGQSQTPGHSSSEHVQARPLLHRITASFVVKSLLFLYCILPYLTLLVRIILAAEQRFQLSQLVIAGALKVIQYLVQWWQTTMIQAPTYPGDFSTNDNPKRETNPIAEKAIPDIYETYPHTTSLSESLLPSPLYRHSTPLTPNGASSSPISSLVTATIVQSLESILEGFWDGMHEGMNVKS